MSQNLVNGDVPRLIRYRGGKHRHQIRRAVQKNPIANPLQVLKHRLECQNPEPHRRGREGRHPHIGPHVHHHPAPAAGGGDPGEDVLDGGGDVGAAEALSLEGAGDVLVGLVGEGSEVSEGVEEGAGDAFDEVGYDRRGLGGGDAVEGGERVDLGGGGGDGLGDGAGGVVGGGGGEEEDEEEGEEGEGKEEEELDGRGGGWLLPLPSIRH